MWDSASWLGGGGGGVEGGRSCGVGPVWLQSALDTPACSVWWVRGDG